MRQVADVKKREVTIAALALSREAGSRDIAFRVVCSKGTYIRSLVNDLVRCAAPRSALLAAHVPLAFSRAQRLLPAHGGSSSRRVSRVQAQRAHGFWVLAHVSTNARHCA